MRNNNGSNLERQLQDRVNEFVTEIVGLATSLAEERVREQVYGRLQAVFNGGGSRTESSGRAVAKRGSNRRTGRRGRALSSGRGRGQKRSPEELEQLTVSLKKAISKGPGRRIEEIAPELGVSTKELQLPVKKLVESKDIKTKGQKRATKYYARA